MHLGITFRNRKETNVGMCKTLRVKHEVSWRDPQGFTWLTAALIEARQQYFLRATR